jgi:hypothetical protein
MEQELEALKAYVNQIRARNQIYVPAKDDDVDNQLAEYINNYPERSKLRIMFLRESTGVYQFGARKVCIKVDKDKINSKSIRV